MFNGNPGPPGAAQYLMKVVFPVEYWPTSSTMGLLWKSAASRAGEWKSWKRYVSYSGSSFLV